MNYERHDFTLAVMTCLTLLSNDNWSHAWKSGVTLIQNYFAVISVWQRDYKFLEEIKLNWYNELDWSFEVVITQHIN